MLLFYINILLLTLSTRAKIVSQETFRALNSLTTSMIGGDIIYQEMIDLISPKFTNKEINKSIEMLHTRQIITERLLKDKEEKRKVLTKEKELISNGIVLLEKRIDDLVQLKSISKIDLKFFYILIDELKKEFHEKYRLRNSSVNIPF